MNADFNPVFEVRIRLRQIKAVAYKWVVLNGDLLTEKNESLDSSVAPISQMVDNSFWDKLGSSSSRSTTLSVDVTGVNIEICSSIFEASSVPGIRPH